MPAFYRRSLTEFLVDDPELILGCLTVRSSQAGYFQQIHAQTAAWAVQIQILKAMARTLSCRMPTATWHLLLEYPIARRGKRIDAILIAHNVVMVLEFKCGAKEYASEAIAQVEDYCLDLADFHEESRDRPLVPMLVATEADDRPPPPEAVATPVKEIWLANSKNLALRIIECFGRYSRPSAAPISPDRWDSAPYSPTPTIIEAARALYSGQNVAEISRCSAGIENLTETTQAVLDAIERSRSTGRKQICFITGVPGAGKTLAGLNIVHNAKLQDGDLGVFLSGNAPLVRVLTEALARDATAQNRLGRSQGRRQVSTFIQNVHRFIDAYFDQPGSVPVDRVVIFDEAQRAWDQAQSNRKFQRPFSEPETLLSIMDRHTGWATVVALVGGGQEINRGEAGLAEWGRAIRSRFPHWEVSISPDLKAGTHATGACLFPEHPANFDIREVPSLHLRVNIRSYKAEALSEFIDALLSLDPNRARAVFGQLVDFPLFLTRDLDVARRWLRAHRRGHRRIGLVASSGARRLRAHGLDVTSELDVENWFLNGPDDVRSSNYLEVPATEFGIQGLELDWVGLGWGGDLHPNEARNGWICRSFRGTRWQQIRDDVMRRYVINKYRVLLTRAREGMVVWVPPGDESDATRPPGVYDQIASYLESCGIPKAEAH